MSATKIMLAAIALGVIGRWANNQKAVPSAQGVIQVLFALILISALDNGRTEPIARGFAWLFLAAILLSDNSPLTGLAKSTGTGQKLSAAQVTATIENNLHKSK